MKRLIKFIKNIKGYWQLERDYKYEPNTYDFIIRQYSDILCSRTKTMSKPTYYATDIIGEIDKWYKELYEEKENNMEQKIIDNIYDTTKEIEVATKRGVLNNEELTESVYYLAKTLNVLAETIHNISK